MGKYNQALKKIQEARIQHALDNRDNAERYFGYMSGLEKAEEILYTLQQQSNANGQKLWYTGSPNDIKPDNCGDYILIMKSRFTSEDEDIKPGDIFISASYWNGEEWEDFNTGDDGWEILYFTKLKWIMFPLPNALGMKRSDKLFFGGSSKNE